MQCPGCQHENRPQAKFCEACGIPLARLEGNAQPALSYADVQRSLTEALEQQTATGDILRVISRSPTDAQPVFDAIVLNASRLCGGEYAIVIRYDGELMHLAAQHNPRPGAAESVAQLFPRAPARGSSNGRAILNRSPVHIPDVLEDPEYDLDFATAAGLRGVLSIPMLRDGRAIGAIAVSRDTPGPFAQIQIELLQTFADQAVIAIENVRLFTELQVSNRDLTRALDQQTATSEILRVISRSPSDVQPVFDTIVASAARLCHAVMASVLLTDGQTLYLPANYGSSPEALSAVRARFPLPLDRETVSGTAILTRSVVHVPDVQEPSVVEFTRQAGQALGYRSLIAVPMLRVGEVVGAINVCRREPGRFSDAEVELLQTFADQAVIAIENVRLFTQLQASNRELTEALDRQTATSEILRVISSSPTDTQPVFDTIAANAARLCAARDAQVLRVEGDVLRLVSAYGSPSMPPVRSISRGHAVGRAVIDCQTIHVRDMAQAIREFPETSAPQHGVESVLAVPLLRNNVAVGVIRVSRTQVQPFTDDEITLLKTFADQALIAIENVRLFTELQERNRALTEAHTQMTEALEQQTATGEVLRAIAHTQTDAQPVFETIVQSAARLCRAAVAGIFLTDGRMVTQRAGYGASPEARAANRVNYPRPVGMDSMPGAAILTRSIVHLPDSEEPPAVEFAGLARQVGRVLGFRSVLAVPMLREGEPVGAITAARGEPGGFSDGEVALLKTFADQAVIAVENVRLLTELQARTAALTRSVDQLTALGEVGRAVSSTLDLGTVLTTIVSRAVQLSGLDGGVVFEYDTGAEEFVHRAATETGGVRAEARRATRVRKGEGVVGRTAITLEPVQVPDITGPGAYVGANRENLIESGIRAILAVPMVREDRLIGCLVVSRNRPGGFPAETIEMLRTFATQSALAIENARLFHEIEDKSRQLEVASQHKSEFLANMSHELRTPLNAIIGFSEVLMQRMFGELNAKQEEYLKDIYESGRHLLSLINDILDLSKIEAGRMELELTAFDLPTAIDSALTLVRERATRRGIALQKTFDERVGPVQGDERKVRQVVLNLLSNAIKFTPEGGRIEIHVVPADGSVEVSVRDTGVGIAPADQEAVFEEFRQVGSSAAKQEGTGLGLALCRKFVELHGGTIWVTSAVGTGSTFTFRLPVRP